MAMLRSSTSIILENTSLLIHLLSKYSPQTSVLIRENALSSGILLRHFHSAIFSSLEGQRFLSRYLCSLWISGPMECEEKRLLKRMVPAGFMGFLKMPILSKVEEDQLDEMERGGIEEGDNENRTKDKSFITLDASGVGTNTARLRSRISIATSATLGRGSSGSKYLTDENFRIFFHVLTKDHALPDLIWNAQTRRELRIAIESELQSIQREIETRGGIDNIAWNHQQFSVPYPSLHNEVQVGNVYMRLWLQTGDSFIKSWEDPVRLFELLFRRLLCDFDRDILVSTLQESILGFNAFHLRKLKQFFLFFL